MSVSAPHAPAWEGSDELRRMWQTKSARFIAHERLRRRHFANAYTTAILSFYVFCSGLVVSFAGISLPELDKAVLTYGSIILSVLIIIVSLLEASKNHLTVAEGLHRSAREISGIYSRGAGLIQGGGNISGLLEEYEAVLDRCPYNHEDIDFAVMRARHRDEFAVGPLSAALVKCRYVLSIYGFNAVLILLPVILAVGYAFLRVRGGTGG